MKKAEKHMYDEANMDGAGQYLHTFAMTYFPLNLITSGPLTYLLSQWHFSADKALTPLSNQKTIDASNSQWENTGKERSQ